MNQIDINFGKGQLSGKHNLSFFSIILSIYLNSVHELIAVFIQRGTCIESIYLRKEKQRHLCQDTYFRSPPSSISKSFHHLAHLACQFLAFFCVKSVSEHI